MRILICEGIWAFIVVEGWHLFLGIEVFFLTEILLNSPKRDGQDIFL